MSVFAMSWALEHSESTGSERLVLLALADAASNDDWTCYPGIRRIAHLARVSESTVHRCLRALEETGDISIDPNGSPDERQQKNRRTNLYRIAPHLDLEDGVSQLIPQKIRRGVKQPPFGVSSGVSTVTPKPLKEPSLNRDDVSRHLADTHSCELCAGGWIEQEDGTVLPCPHSGYLAVVK